MIEREDAIRYKTNLGAHLAELGCYFGREVREGELVPLSESRRIVAEARRRFTTRQHDKTSLVIPFADKAAPRFRAFLERMEPSGSGGAYAWTGRSEACGLCRLRSVRELDPAFRFDCDPHELVVLYSSDLDNSLLLDFYEADSGTQELKVEVSGRRWSGTEY